MPVYEARCEECGTVKDYYRSVDLCHVTPFCCGFQMTKVILSAPYGVVDIPAYQSPVTGKWINSRKERTEDLKRNNSRPWEGMEQEQKEADRQRAYQEAKEDAKLEQCISETLSAMPPEKKESLGVL